MANSNTIFGARYIGNLLGCTENAKLTPYTVPATDATALFMGDFVKLTGADSLGEDGVYHPVVTQLAATEQSVGYVVGFGVNPNALDKVYRPASTLRTAWVINDPYSIFEIQSTGTAAAGDSGQLADITVGAGSTVTGLSGMQLDRSTLSSASGQLRILWLSHGINSEYGAYTKFVCMINEHAYKATTGV